MITVYLRRFAGLTSLFSNFALSHFSETWPEGILGSSVISWYVLPESGLAAPLSRPAESRSNACCCSYSTSANGPLDRASDKVRPERDGDEGAGDQHGDHFACGNDPRRPGRM